jgi:hypothetical protein
MPKQLSFDDHDPVDNGLFVDEEAAHQVIR